MKADLSFGIADNTEELLKATAEQIEKALTAVGHEAVARVNPLVPVDTGRLRASITSEVDGQTVNVGTNVEYAPYVEMGTGVYAEEGGRPTPWWYQDDKGEWHFTHGQKPAHFIRDGLANNLDEYKRILQEVLEEG